MPFESKVDWLKELPNIQIAAESGKNMAQIAKDYGVSRQRLKQITQRHFPNWKDDFVYRRSKEQKAAHQKRWGNKETTELYKTQLAKFRAKKSNALRTGYTWDVQFGEIQWPTHCPILGLELEFFAEYRQENSVSFDRIDSSKGYEAGNIQIISWRANRIKNDGTAEEHRKIADYIDSLHKVTLVSIE